MHWPGPVNIIKFETGIDFDKKVECFTLNTFEFLTFFYLIFLGFLYISDIYY